jgi:two-component system CheB/CheR fusion protein
MAIKNKKEQPRSKASNSKKESNNNLPLAVVGIGASAGGLDAISELLKGIPQDTGMAFVIIQHLEPKYKSKLPEIVSRLTPLPVNSVKNRMRVQSYCYQQ